MRVNHIAYVGGQAGHYKEEEIAAYFQKVRAKYPEANIITGSAPGAEAQIRELATFCELDVTIPPVREELYDDALLMQVCEIVALGDVIICMGTRGGKRVKLALEILKRVDTCREPHNRRHVVHIAEMKVPEAKAEPKGRVKSKRQRNARETA